MQLNVKGRAAVVTGGGSGIGNAIVKALLQAGAHVASWDLKDSEALQALQQQYGDRLLSLQVDVADADAVKQAGEKTVSRFAKPDLIVNAAGIMYKRPLEEIELDAWDRIYNIHAKGTLLVSRFFAPYLKQSGNGRIINIASMTAIIGLETYMPYSSSKAAVANMTKVMAAELASYGVTVNAICPGWVETPMLEGLFDRIAEIHGYDRNKAIEEVLSHIPGKHFVHPDEIAFCVLFLASPMARSISAADFMIDSGLTNTFKPGLHMIHA
jgi:NAD(P)-dependent dehydrogenase (short-subunit alcohol dehydrogenase family)